LRKGPGLSGLRGFALLIHISLQDGHHLAGRFLEQAYQPGGRSHKQTQQLGTGFGEGGQFAQSAALALLENTDKNAEEIVRASMKIAGDICVYTNHSLVIEKL